MWDYNEKSKPPNHLQDLHGLAGIVAVSLFGLNLAIGLYFYLVGAYFKNLDPPGYAKKAAMPVHVFLGISSLFFTILALFTGIEKLLKPQGSDGNQTLQNQALSLGLIVAFLFVAVGGVIYQGGRRKLK